MKLLYLFVKILFHPDSAYSYALNLIVNEELPRK